MRLIAILFAAAASLSLPDATPKEGHFEPRGLAELRSFAAPGVWLVGPGGRFIATNAGNDEIGLIDVATGHELGLLGGHAPTGKHDGNWSANGRILASAGDDTSVKVWDAVTRREINSFTPHAGYT
jgi:WD40 repeat protein